MKDLRCIETIKIEHNIAHNIRYHQARFDRTRKELWGAKEPIELSREIDAPTEALYKCRITYGEKIEKIEYLPYVKKLPQSFVLVESELDYSYKFADRSAIEALKVQGEQKEIIITKKGYLTDTSIANIAFFNGKEWFTPKRALLRGTMRAKLLDEGLIKEEDIKIEDLEKYTNFALINAMLGFEIINRAKIEREAQCLKIF
jgi:4-amino-4-deoxychorismate lyase